MLKVYGQVHVRDIRDSGGAILRTFREPIQFFKEENVKRQQKRIIQLVKSVLESQVFLRQDPLLRLLSTETMW